MEKPFSSGCYLGVRPWYEALIPSCLSFYSYWKFKLVNPVEFSSFSRHVYHIYFHDFLMLCMFLKDPYVIWLMYLLCGSTFSICNIVYHYMSLWTFEYAFEINCMYSPLYCVEKAFFAKHWSSYEYDKCLNLLHDGILDVVPTSLL